MRLPQGSSLRPACSGGKKAIPLPVDHCEGTSETSARQVVIRKDVAIARSLAGGADNLVYGYVELLELS